MKWIMSLALVAVLFAVGCKQEAAKEAAPETPAEKPVEQP